MQGANGDMNVSLVSVLYQCFTKSVPLPLQKGLAMVFFSIVDRVLGNKSAVEEKYCIKCTRYIEVTISEQGRANGLNKYFISLACCVCLEILKGQGLQFAIFFLIVNMFHGQSQSNNELILLTRFVYVSTA